MELIKEDEINGWRVTIHEKKGSHVTTYVVRAGFAIREFVTLEQAQDRFQLWVESTPRDGI
jgi:hypothetical protein